MFFSEGPSESKGDGEGQWVFAAVGLDGTACVDIPLQGRLDEEGSVPAEVQLCAQSYDGGELHRSRKVFGGGSTAAVGCLVGDFCCGADGEVHLQACQSIEAPTVAADEAIVEVQGKPEIVQRLLGVLIEGDVALVEGGVEA